MIKFASTITSAIYQAAQYAHQASLFSNVYEDTLFISQLVTVCV